jgi:hypothetical protein
MNLNLNQMNFYGHVFPDFGPYDKMGVEVFKMHQIHEYGHVFG